MSTVALNRAQADEVALDRVEAGPVTLNRVGPSLNDPGGIRRGGWGQHFGEYFGTWTQITAGSGTTLELKLTGDCRMPSFPILRVVEDDTEPTVFAITANGSPVDLELKIDTITLRMKSRRGGGSMKIDRTIPTSNIGNVNEVTVEWQAGDFDTPDHYWLEMEFDYSAGYQASYPNRGKAFVVVEPKLS